MVLTFFDINEQVANALAEEFAGTRDVLAISASLEEVPSCDCIISPGNSFGMMDSGGVDSAIALMLPKAQRNLRDALAVDFRGEMPVGNATIVPSEDEPFHWLAYSPTMRVPRPIASETVYDAFRAALLAIEKHNATLMIDAMAEIEDPNDELRIPEGMLIKSVACPGFGTKSGGVGARTSAHMMKLAYDSVYEHVSRRYETWEEIDNHVNKIFQHRR